MNKIDDLIEDFVSEEDTINKLERFIKVLEQIELWTTQFDEGFKRYKDKYLSKEHLLDYVESNINRFKSVNVSEITEFLKEEKKFEARRRIFQSGVCPDCGKRLSGKHTMGEGWTYYPCECQNVKIDPKTIEHIKKALFPECANCGNSVDDDDNTITFEKDGKAITGKVCSDCYYKLEEIEKQKPFRRCYGGREK